MPFQSYMYPVSIRNYLMSIGINNPRYVMTAKDHVGYYRWARELEEKLQKQRELKQND